MTSTENVHNAHMDRQLRVLHEALLDIVSVINRPDRDEAMIRAAGIRLDRALFPLLVGIDRYGPIGIVDLADRAGRDHTTVSRQVAKLAALGLVARQGGAGDRRVRAAVVTPEGRAMVARIDAARRRMGYAVFADWTAGEVDEFARLLRRFADRVKAGPPEA